MCLLTFLPAGVMPNLEALTNGTMLNNDGHGFAIVTNDRLLVHRGMDAEQTIDAFAQTRARHPDGPALFHSRFGTHGTTVLENCHPIPVGGDTRTVIAHNGVLPKDVRPAIKDPRSDTRIAAEVFLPTFGSLKLRRNRLRLQRWMGQDNKMVILTVDRRFTRRAYILNEQAGTWDGGIWYSNDGYLTPAHHRRLGNLWWTVGWEPTGRYEALERCWNCHALTEADAPCAVCGCCLDCTAPVERCLCYQPAALTASADNDVVRTGPGAPPKR